MKTNYTTQDRGNRQEYRQYLDAMDAIAVEKVASASSFFEPAKGNVVVDVGMASGTSSAILAGLFPELSVIGVDINPKMVDIAGQTYQLPNLSFRTDDGEKLESFEEGSVNGFFNCSSIHHITSFNGYNNNHALRTLQRQTALLKEKGILVVRDFVKPEEEEVLLLLSTEEKKDRPCDAELLLEFSRTARSLAPRGQRGFPVVEEINKASSSRSFRLPYTDAVEFIRRKDYYDNWEIELQEEYGYYTQREFENIFRNLGLRILISMPIYNPWIIRNRYQGQFKLYNRSGKEIGFPPTNYLIVGEKISRGKEIMQTRHLPLSHQSFLQYNSFQQEGSGKIYDVVHRPQEVIDILPYIREGNQITILAKHGYPRPLLGVKTDSSNLDNKYFSGYITEVLTMEKGGNIKEELAKRFGLAQDQLKGLSEGLTYFTSPGGIDEKATSLHLELSDIPTQVHSLQNGYSGFRESGFIHSYNAAQLLTTAQTGAIAEARLELNIYHLFFRQGITLPHWIGEKVQVEESHLPPVMIWNELTSLPSKNYIESNETAGFLRTEKVLFTEAGVTDSSTVREYVYPRIHSNNTLVTLPVTRFNDRYYVGLEVRSLPVPQKHTGNSLIFTAPAKRLPKTVTNLFEMKQYITEMNIGNNTIENHFRLGEKYYPSIGITPEQVYPFVVCMNRPSTSLSWIALDELMRHFEELKDAHLLICLARLYHALGYNSK